MKKFFLLSLIIAISPAYALPIPEFTSAVFGMGEIALIVFTALTLYFPFLRGIKKTSALIYFILLLSLCFNIYYFFSGYFPSDLPMEKRPGMIMTQEERNTDPHSIDEFEAYKILNSPKKDTQYLFVDARSMSETELGTAQGFTKIRWPDIVEQKERLKGRTVIATCWTGMRGSEVCAKLREHGIDCLYLREGLKGWMAKNLPVILNAGVSKEIFGTGETFENSEKFLTSKQLDQALQSTKVALIDARGKSEYESGHLKGSINIPFSELTTPEMEYRVKSLSSQAVVAVCYGSIGCSEAPGWGWEMKRLGLRYVGAYSSAAGEEKTNLLSRLPDKVEHQILFVLSCLIMGIVLFFTKSLSMSYFSQMKIRKDKLKALNTMYPDSLVAARHHKSDIWGISKSFVVLGLALFYTGFIQQVASWNLNIPLLNKLSKLNEGNILISLISLIIAITLIRIILKKINPGFFVILGIFWLLSFMVLKNFSFLQVLILGCSFLISVCLDMIVNNGFLSLDKAWHSIEPDTKAYRLSWLKSLGYPVPGGIVVRQGERLRMPHLPEPWAVRSSAIGEDSQTSSHAGIFLSVVPSSKTTYLQDIKAVFNSYKNKNEIVLVQKLIQPQFSGVAFSKHPSWGGVSLIEWGEGLSGKRLDGSEDAQQIVVERANGQNVMGEFLHYKEVYELLRKVEAQYHMPMDIEWAIDKSAKVWLLQARPQTSLAYNHSERDRDNILQVGFRELKECELSHGVQTRLSASLVCYLWREGGSAELASRMALWRWKAGSLYKFAFGQVWQCDSDLIAPNKISWLMAKKSFKNNFLNIEARKNKLLTQKKINLATSWDKLDTSEWMAFFHDVLADWEEMQKFSFYFEFMAQSSINDCRRYKDFNDDLLTGYFYPSDISYRSDMDYELSCPRYIETGCGTIPGMKEHYKEISNTTLKEKVMFTNKLIYLRDEYKHYSMSIYYILRRACIDLSRRASEDIYHIDFQDIESVLEGKKIEAEVFYPNLLSTMNAKEVALYQKTILEKHSSTYNYQNHQGEFVSNACATGGYLVKISAYNSELESILSKESILYCKAISPKMVEIASRAGVKAICSQYGSTLSHPAILAREAKIPFLIKVNLDDLEGYISIDTTGLVTGK